MKILFFSCLFLIVELNPISALLKMDKYVLRNPKRTDIGLIFDVTIVNESNMKKEMFELRVRSNGNCKIQLANNEIINCANRIIGGYYGPVDADTTEIISVIWPTTSHFNRVGTCPIDIISIDTNKKITHSRQILSFDTKCTTLDPSGQSLRAQKNYKDCGNNFDLDNFKNCEPVDCIERYFGYRSYFNKTKQTCEEVPRCVGPHQTYDKWQNECVNSVDFFNEDDIKKIRRGHFKTASPGSPMTCKDGPNPVKQKEYKTEKLSNTKSEIKRETESDYKFLSNPFGLSSLHIPAWLEGLGNGFLLVLITLFIYLAICFIIFLIINWVSRRECWDNSDPIQLDKTPLIECDCDELSREEISTSSLLSIR